MKKNSLKIILMLAIIFLPYFFVSAASTWFYTVTYKTNTISTTSDDFSSLSACNTERSAYMNSDEYKNNPTIYNIPGVCTEKKDPVTPLTGKQIAAGDKYDPIYHLLAPIGNFTEIKTDDIGGYFSKIFLIAIGLCGALAVIMFVIGGIEYMGEESIWGKAKGKEQMTGAILGLLIALGSWALLNTINPDLLGGSGLLISSANIKLEPKSGGGYYGGTIGDPNNPNVNKNITEWDVYLKNASQLYGVECTAIKAFMYAESAGVNGLTSPSPANAKGLIQLVDSTFKEQNVGNDPMDPQTNINAGAKYLKNLKSTGCNSKPTSSVCDISNMQYWAASYNGGPGANKESTDSSCKTQTIWQCLNNSGYAQTRVYAPRVEANYNKLKEKGWGC